MPNIEGLPITTSPSMSYRLLFRNERKTLLRALRARQRPFVWFVLGVLGLYLAFTLVILGTYFGRFTAQLHLTAHPLEVVNTYLLSGLYGLFGIRFLFQRTPALRLQPYLHLPISRRRLVQFFQAVSVLNLHNVYPFLFFIPFWLAHVRPAVPGTASWAWLGGVTACILASNYLNLFLRSLLTRYEGWFLFLMLLLTGVLYLDQRLGTGVALTASRALFDGVVGLRPRALLAVLAPVLALPPVSSALLHRQLRNPTPDLPEHRATLRIPFLENAGKLGQLILLEGRLMWRNRRPRHYLFISVLFSTLYLVFLLVSPPAEGGLLIGAIVGLFASGSFAMNYGQLMFSWESAYFDGLLARNLSLRLVTFTKLLLLQGSCVILFLVSLPLFLWLRPDWLGLHLAFLFYNAGVTSWLVMLLALGNRRPVNLSRSGGFFNYEGFSAAHWVWFIPTVVPPTLVLLLFRHSPTLALGLIATLGLLGLSLYRVLGGFFAGRLARHRYAMAAGFRQPHDR